MKIGSTTLNIKTLSTHSEYNNNLIYSENGLQWNNFFNSTTLENSLLLETISPPLQSRPPFSFKNTQETVAFQNSTENTIHSFQEKNKKDSAKQVTSTRSSDSLSFHSLGTVQTTDGRTIDFALDLTTTYKERNLSLKDSILIDPITLSFDNGFASLKETTFSFDLNNDGKKEKIAALDTNSGFLAFDKNKDGKINNGGELFGPQTGYGYKELRKYDSDHNMWIDENDPIFNELKVWIGAGTKDAKLLSLKEAGVGALSLASGSTDFDMKSTEGRLLGKVTQAGLFLMENGEPHSMQEIKLNSDRNQYEENSLYQKLYLSIERLNALIKQHIENESTSTLSTTLLRRKTVVQMHLEEKFWSWQK